MRLRVSAPGRELKSTEVDLIEKDLEKLDRRLNQDHSEAEAEVRISENSNNGATGFHVVMEVHNGRHHYLAKAGHTDMRQAIREAREEVLRQIKDRSRGGHSWFLKRR